MVAVPTTFSPPLQGLKLLNQLVNQRKNIHKLIVNTPGCLLEYAGRERLEGWRGKRTWNSLPLRNECSAYIEAKT